MATKTQEWLVITPQERLSSMKDFVRAAEDALWRLQLTSFSDPTREARIKTAQTEVDTLQAKYKALLDEVSAK